MFKDKTLLITGGTGSFGNAVCQKFLKSDLKEIRIFSRDEKKQDDMRKKFKSPKLKLLIGDVRDINSINPVMKNVDFVFHAAALKQVPSCEFYPLEALKTNILGTENVLESAVSNNVKKVICLSTDKAVYPINAMGMSKALMEKVIVAKSRNLSNKETQICCTRYGNVMASRGSVIPLFLRQIFENKPITITDPNMTRFMMTLEDAVDLVLHAFKKGKNGDIFVQKSPASTIKELVNALTTITNTKPNVKVIGTRHGEKKYEVLCSREEMFVAEDQGNFFRIPSDNRDLNYSKYFEKGERNLSEVEDYNSNNTYRLKDEELIALLRKLDFIKQIEKGIKDIPEGV